MTADVELLPLPEPDGSYTNPYDGDDLENYARANIAPLKAEIEALLAENERMKNMALMQAARASAAERETEALRADLADYMRIANTEATRAERLTEALRSILYYIEEGGYGYGHSCERVARAALHPTAAQEDGK